MVKVELNKRDLANIQARMNTLVNLADNLAPALNEIGDYLVSETTQRFRDSTAPDGSQWGSVKPRRKRKDKKTGQYKSADSNPKALVDFGHLRDSITYQSTNNSVEIGSNLIYAAIHQLGGQAGRGRSVTISSRPFLGVNIQDETEIRNILIKNIQKALA